MLSTDELQAFATASPDTSRTPESVIRSFFDLWISASQAADKGEAIDYKLFLPYCARSWIQHPTLRDGFPVEAIHADALLEGMLSSYAMAELESFTAPEPEGDEITIPVVTLFSVPIYPDPEKEEYSMKEYRRKMLLRCVREEGEWRLDPNSTLDQDCV